MLPRRRIGHARAYDVFDDAGAVVVRNITAEAATTFATSLTEAEVVEAVATRGFVDADGHRITSHMAISGT
jgi:hypothetical protein